MDRSHWLLHQLEYDTRTHHIAADVARMALLGSSTTVDRYLAYLERTYAFEAPVEARWREIAALDAVIPIEQRIRTPFLASDLRMLGVQPESLAPAQFAGVEQALGWMYVVERGRRMNGMLHRHLVRRLPRVMAIAGNYLYASSPSGTRWQQLGLAIEAFAKQQTVAEQIVNAAHRAFRTLRGAPAAQAA